LNNNTGSKLTNLNIMKEDIDSIIDISTSLLNMEIKDKKIFLIGSSGYGKSSIFNSLLGKNIQKISNTNSGTLGISKSESFYNFDLIDCEGYNNDIQNFNKELMKIIKKGDLIIYVENYLNRYNLKIIKKN
jgi:predicted GTPase